ncbi:bark storage protein A-like isoform X1 [Mercurialis annua]|uniref:bark storage protein A-like isoform X1 n=1 Tax=Mercurialis annua TaxID=3986 RepID=UPI00215F1D5C|nr:bark storage protein A-like isoform X1 [Mercurialis annua]
MAGRSRFMLVVLILLFVVVSVSGTPSKKKISWSRIKKINKKGPYIGLITVYPPEENAFFSTRAFKSDSRYPFLDLSGRRFRVGRIYDRKVIYVRCGIGMVNAAAATQQMLDLFDITGIIHFGISGNVNNSMFIGDVSIPKQFAHTGLWDWMNPNGTVDSNDVAQLKIGGYNVPQNDGFNLLGKIGFSREQFFSVSTEGNAAAPMFWAEVSHEWLQLAASLEGMELEKCVNSSLCLPKKPKLVVGLKGSTSNSFLDNAAYRDFLFQTFEVTTADMESSAVVMTCLSNGFRVIVIRGMSDLAGSQSGENPIHTFGSLAALNTVKAVLRFIKKIPVDVSHSKSLK